MTGHAQKRANDPEGMRNRVLDAAQESFQVRGYHASSLGDLMAAAGVSGGALHHHFRTKKALALAVIEERVAAAVEETWMAPLRAAASAREGVRAAFEAVAAELEQQGFVRGCPLNNLAHELSLADAELRAALAGIFAGWRQAIADKVRADQQAGREQDTDPQRFAALAVAAYSGAMSMAKTAQDAGMLRDCLAGLEQSVAQASPMAATRRRRRILLPPGNL
ncbi:MULTISPECIES: TetR/AcrR family transcriptional regulator [unclassified Mesorhizobium]|uniref:TetR/AcrR family transcriptional regulator n=1 Tax=unclassified Mesorhizobium TaxID=325217 RepID=UPI00112656A4|nr:MULTISPECIES: TetR/AcrR family transcriptional regulator [unclassified Mesorhizobium]TPJ38636.1 TetR/AcrR family transcriptional regulator [Mesorhizobium sp. B2-6-6]MCA0003764.1 TetR/AcrR family transcriptional regulator [Mesorhizobium sp. B264B2A]MCA0010250.1 TetR/AcrR family transcriptional regulator [Mesorhizobium sp. B264B1B]MCA0022834.1 TetR/AcrR family transcriptional regulator [Mesorhizobium sp. B264B1A]TPK64247.1 TetR/AcrR family transcriptional regulator [Mesorhizobium sp. B2-5-1]